MTYSFIKELCESRLIRSSYSYKKYTARDLADLTFLYFLGIQILRSEFDSKPFAVTYARKTIMWNRIDDFRNGANDLYMLMFALFGKNNESVVELLKKQEASKMLIANMHFNYPQAKQWLFHVAEGYDTNDTDKLFLMKLEAMLKIQVSDYRAIRRLVCDWSDLAQAEREIAMTRLLLAFRARAPQSEILQMLEHVAKENKLEVAVSINPEEPIQKDGKSLKPIAIGAAIGAGLVAMGIKDFLQNAHKGIKFKENIEVDTGENPEKI